MNFFRIMSEQGQMEIETAGLRRSRGERNERISWRIDAGHIISALMFLATLLGVWRTMDARQIQLESQQHTIEVRANEDREAMRRLVEAVSRVNENQIRVSTILETINTKPRS